MALIYVNMWCMSISTTMVGCEQNGLDSDMLYCNILENRVLLKSFMCFVFKFINIL